MEIRQLQYFLAVAETRHFGQAAERLHMAQSPLSQAIRQFEAQLGTALFIRTTRSVALTDAGEALLHDAQRILEAVEAAQVRVRLVGAGSSGLVRVGATGLAAFQHLPHLARIAAREVPGLELRFQAGLLTPELERALGEQRIDLAVLRPPVRDTTLDYRLIARERLVLAVPDAHPLALQASVALAELRDEDFVFYGVPDSVVDTAVTQACLAVGFLPRRAHSASETPIMLTLVAACQGVAVLPESAMALRVDGVHLLPVTDDVHVDLALAWRRDEPSAAVVQLLAALQSDGFTTAGAPAPSPREAASGGSA